MHILIGKCDSCTSLDEYWYIVCLNHQIHTIHINSVELIFFTLLKLNYFSNIILQDIWHSSWLWHEFSFENLEIAGLPCGQYFLKNSSVFNIGPQAQEMAFVSVIFSKRSWNSHYFLSKRIDCFCQSIHCLLHKYFYDINNSEFKFEFVLIVHYWMIYGLRNHPSGQLRIPSHCALCGEYETHRSFAWWHQD